MAGGGWLHNSDTGDVAAVTFLVTGDAAPGSRALSAGVGVRLAVLEGEGSQQAGYGLGVGGVVRYVIPRYERFSVAGAAYWAPAILSGGDADEYLDTTVRLGYSVTRQAEVYLGARYVKADYQDGQTNLFDTGLDAGFALRF